MQDLLDAYGVRASVEAEVGRLHREAKAALAVATTADSPAGTELMGLVETLAGRLR